jgi:hypothetical protein
MTWWARYQPLSLEELPGFPSIRKALYNQAASFPPTTQVIRDLFYTILQDCEQIRISDGRYEKSTFVVLCTAVLITSNFVVFTQIRTGCTPSRSSSQRNSDIVSENSLTVSSRHQHAHLPLTALSRKRIQCQMGLSRTGQILKNLSSNWSISEPVSLSPCGLRNTTRLLKRTG